MRLIKFLQYSSNNAEINQFRAMKIGLVERNTNGKNIVKTISKKYNIGDDILFLLEKLNKDLKKMYRGKYKFDLCMEDHKPINSMRINDQKKAKLQKKCLEFNYELCKIKTSFESYLKLQKYL